MVAGGGYPEGRRAQRLTQAPRPRSPPAAPAAPPQHGAPPSAEPKAGGEETQTDELPPNTDSRFLDVFIFGLWQEGGTCRARAKGSSKQALPGMLSCVDAHLLARCARLCRRSRDLVAVGHVWEPRVRGLCARWGLDRDQLPSAPSWRERFFELLRPRCDGIYVGECRYVHRIRPGASMEAKLMHKSYHWVEYRRYLRLFPPDPKDGTLFALVLRDVCPFEAAVEVLTTMDPRAQVELNGSGAWGEHHRGAHASAAAPVGGGVHGTSQLRGRVAAGTYARSGSRIEVNLKTGSDRYFLAFDLSHSDHDRFAGRLQWLEYYMTDENEEVTNFNLGRSRYGDGGPADSEKDHYPALYIRHCRALEHLL